MRLAPLFALTAFVSLQSAHAQSRPDEIDEATGRRIEIPAEDVVDFTDAVRIEGQLVGPDGKLVMPPPIQRFNPLIRLRQHFDEEMVRSVDTVK